MDASTQIRTLEAQGKEMEEKSFSYQRFAAAYRQFWQLCLPGSYSFTKKNIRIVNTETIERVSSAGLTAEYQKVHESLPLKIQQIVTVKNLQLADNGSLFSIINNIFGKRVITGFYSSQEDICYILKREPLTSKLPEAVYHSVVAAHELSHRYLHHWRIREGIDHLLIDGREEEAACRIVEETFASLTFPKGRRNTPGDLNVGRKMLAKAFSPLLKTSVLAPQQYSQAIELPIFM